MTTGNPALSTQTITILVCDACGAKTPLDLIPTASPACQVCGNYGTDHLHEAVVVPAIIPPAERYIWTPWLERARLSRDGEAIVLRRIVKMPITPGTTLKERVEQARKAVRAGEAAMVEYLTGRTL